MSYKHIIEKLSNGERVQLNPQGNSMTPKIKSKQSIVLSPVRPEDVKSGDIVLAKVKGKHYIHLVTAIDKEKERVQISNNHGHVNGWASFSGVFGIVKPEDIGE